VPASRFVSSGRRLGDEAITPRVRGYVGILLDVGSRRGLQVPRAPFRGTGHHPTRRELQRRRGELRFVQDTQLPEQSALRGICLSSRIAVLLAHQGA